MLLKPLAMQQGALLIPEYSILKMQVSFSYVGCCCVNIIITETEVLSPVLQKGEHLNGRWGYIYT